MKDEDVVLIAEHKDDDARVIERGLRLSGVHSSIVRFADGRKTLDYFFGEGNGGGLDVRKAYVLVLAADIPEVDATEILEKLKADAKLRKVPVIMFGSEEDSAMVERCHSLGCSVYMVKPDEPEGFAETARKIGSFLSVVEMPQIEIDS